VRLWLFVFAAACTGQTSASRDTGLDDLALTKLVPGLVLPKTKIVVSGRSFVDVDLGQTRLRLLGSLGGEAVNVLLPARFVSAATLEASYVPPAGTPTGAFSGEATVEVDSTVDGKTHVSAPLSVQINIADTLAPSVSAVGDGLTFVNQPIEITGAGFLLGGDEGDTRARLTGCFQALKSSVCTPLAVTTPPLEIPAKPSRPYERGGVGFPYRPTISGIGPGTFTGQLVLVNHLADGTTPTTAPLDVTFDVQRPAIFSASTTSASLGQYVVISGGGFVGDGDAEVTLLDIKGTFAPDGGGPERPLDLELVTEFVSGPEARYVIDDSDPLGQLVDLRMESGVILGTAKPVVERGRDRVEGTPIPVALRVLHVKQVVWVNFLPSFVSSLRKFGLRAVDHAVRDRVFAVAKRDYDGVNIEFRPEIPTDFALFAQVDIAGPDPNGLGLLGYDNSPGKDTDNVRLYDHIGGVNATTQEDGYPGFGGVFTEGFFGFSSSPLGAMPIHDETSRFDEIFDPFRPDRGGVEVTATELSKLLPPVLSSGAGCPAAKGERGQQIACAIFVLGSLVGNTMTHEVGHSLGLANPYGDGFHDPGDQPNRLMDSGGDRPFAERTELDGQGPAVFCTDAYDYLRMILPLDTPPPDIQRPSCD